MCISNPTDRDLNMESVQGKAFLELSGMYAIFIYAL